MSSQRVTSRDDSRLFTSCCAGDALAVAISLGPLPHALAQEEAHALNKVSWEYSCRRGSKP